MNLESGQRLISLPIVVVSRLLNQFVLCRESSSILCNDFIV